MITLKFTLLKTAFSPWSKIPSFFTSATEFVLLSNLTQDPFIWSQLWIQRHIFLQPDQVIPPFKEGSSSTGRRSAPLFLPRISASPVLENTPFPMMDWISFLVEADFHQVGPSYKNRKIPSKLATYEKHFFSYRLPIPLLLAKGNTNNASVMRAHIHTWFSYSLCASSYLLSPLSQNVDLHPTKDWPWKTFFYYS